jgi:hypothetical protein
MRSSMRRSATLGAVALTTLGLAATAGASIQQLPPGGQVNDDVAAGIDPARDAGAPDVVGGSLVAGGIRVPWAAFEQQTAGEQQIFVRSFKGGAWKTQGQSLNIDQGKEAEAPSIDFAGAGRTVPWTAWYEPNDNLPGGQTNIFASRFAAAQNKWIPEGQDRAPNNKVPSLNIHTDQEAENPALAGGAVTPGNDPVPWVAWQEKDGGDSTTATDQIFVSRGIKQTDCSANQPGGGTSVSAFCWQQVGLGRLKADSHDPGPDPTLSVDPTRNGIEPDIAFTGANDTVPWVVWYEVDDSKIDGLHNNDMVFAAKAVNDGGGKFHWVVVGNRASDTLDSSGTNKFGGAAESATAEGDASLNADPDAGAEDPRVASGTLTPGGATVPWVAWAEDTRSGKKAIFVSRLVGGTHFELANGGKPISSLKSDADDPDITFSGNTPYVTYHQDDKVVAGHFANLTTFKVDTVTKEKASGRSPVSSSNTSDPFTADGQNPPAGTVGTPFFLTVTDPAPHKLLAKAYRPDDVRTFSATDVHRHSAHIAGSVNPAGAPVKVHFEYGLTTAYGSQTADQSIAPGNNPVFFDADLTGLPSKTFVHYRSVAVTDFGVVNGPDRVLRTDGKHHHYSLINQKRLWLSHTGNVIVRMSCPGGVRCSGTVKLTAKHRTLGRAHYSIGGHRIKSVKVHLKPKAQDLVRSSHKLRVKVTTGGAHRTLVMRWTR